MHWWCVLFILPVLMAGALSPDVGCLNTTIVAGIQPVVDEHAHVDYSTSIVDTGLLLNSFSHLVSVVRQLYVKVTTI